MTVKQLIERLKELPQDIPVIFENDGLEVEVGAAELVNTNYVDFVDETKDCVLLESAAYLELQAKFQAEKEAEEEKYRNMTSTERAKAEILKWKGLQGE